VPDATKGVGSNDVTSATAMFLASASLLGLVACGGAERVRHVEAAQASAGEIVDGDGLRLDLGKTPRCVILPRRLQVPADCGGMDLGSAADRAEASVKSLGVANASVVALVMWRLPGGEDAIMTVMSLPHSQFPPAAENVGDGLAGFYNSVHAPENKVRMRDDPRLAHDRITVAATPAVRYASDTQQGGEAARLSPLRGEAHLRFPIPHAHTR
jgi:hypothetical protein